MSYTAAFLKKMKNLEEENKKLREFKERTEEECGASAVMNDFMDRIQDLENENKEIKEKNNKQQVVIVNETIEKEKAQIEKEKALASWKEEAEALAEEVAENNAQLDMWESGEVGLDTEWRQHRTHIQEIYELVDPTAEEYIDNFQDFKGKLQELWDEYGFVQLW